MSKAAFITLCFFPLLANAQAERNLIAVDSQQFKNKFFGRPIKQLPAKSFLIPGVLIVYGCTSLEVEAIDNINEKLSRKITTNYPAFHTNVDDYLMFAPSAGVFLLDAVGIKGKHNLKEKTKIYITGLALTNIVVYSFKKITNELRPDGSHSNSFPSGHTAMAFFGAEILHKEYGFRSPWISVAGYTVAATTGVFRMLNNKHWFSDVVAGAGFGILSAKLSYWLFSKIEKKRGRSSVELSY